PSHTYCQRLPSTVIDGTHLLWRLRAGKPVLLHDGGATQWTLTRSEDFARGFVQLFGLPRALGEAYHITDNVAHSWQHIFASIAQLAGTDLQTCSVPSTTLVEHIELLRGPLLGDKANSLLFDNTKIAEATGGWRCEIGLNDGLAKALTHTQQQLDAGYAPPQPLDGQIDQIIAAHTSGATQ
ncbi:MAG TPA: RNA-binding protein, partial [Gammaproteobacteria bacterium]|nr:RNA-binding protein [Gammaproteobacteria bacterium]